jgi:hypothetical protein
MSDVESPLATMTAILTSVGVSASQPKADRQREPDQIRQPLVDQRHLRGAPRQHRGQPQHGLIGLPGLF